MALNYQAAVNITANYTGDRQVQKAKDDFRQLGTNVADMKNGMSNAVGALKALAGAFVVREAVEFAKNLLDVGVQMDELRQKTGISVEVLSSMKSAAEDNGLEFEKLEGGLKKYSVTLAQAQAGNQKSVAGFQAMGLSLKDLKNQSPDQVLAKLADKFQAMQDGPTKAALAASIFGQKVGPDLIPLLNKGSDALDKFGLKMSTEFAARAHAFEDTMNAIKRSSQQVGVDALDKLLPTLQEIANAFIDFNKKSAPGADTMLKISDGMRLLATGAIGLATVFGEGLDTIKSALDSLGTFMGEWIANRVDRLKTFGEEASLAFKGQWDKISVIENEFQARTLDSQKRVSDESQRIREEYFKRSEDRIKKFQDFQAAVSKNAGNSTGAAADTKPDTSNKTSGASEYDRTQYVADLKLIEKLKSEKEKQQQLNDLEAKKVDLSTAAYQKQKLALDDNIKNHEELKHVLPEHQAEVKKLQDSVEALKQAEIDQAEQEKKSFGAGAKEAFKSYAEAAADTAAQTKHLFTTALTGIEDAFVELVKNGKLSFKSLADAIETELIRIAVRKAILAGITSVGLGAATGGAAFADGGVMTSSGPVPLKKYANGGVATSPQMALFGEGSRPEAYVPLPDGRSIPVTMKGQGGNGTSVMVNVTVNSDGSTQSDTQSSEQKGKDLGKLLEVQMTEFVLKQKRPGGLLA